MLTGVARGVSSSRMMRDEKEDEEGDWNMFCYSTLVGFSRVRGNPKGIIMTDVGLLLMETNGKLRMGWHHPRLRVVAWNWMRMSASWESRTGLGTCSIAVP